MEKLFLEYPWLSHAYICSNCASEFYHLFRFCPSCGKEFDYKTAVESDQDRPCVLDIEEIKAILDDLRGLQVRLWDYTISHAVLQLRVAHCAANESENRFNTVIGSAETKRVSVSTRSWSADLTIETTEGEYGTIYKLTDKKAGFLLEAGRIGIYQNMPALFFA
jgi:hypothetical protein